MAYRLEGNCWHCGEQLGAPDYARESRCPQCQKATHVCRNCRWFKSSAPGQCSEPTADPVSDKERPNFCGYFDAANNHRSNTQDAAAIAQAAEDLFDL